MRSILIFLLVLPFYISGQTFRYSDKIRILEAVNISKQYGDMIWENFNETPFTLLLVADDYEFLLYHDNPTEDFKLYKYDASLKTRIYFRKRQFDPQLLATFPAINNVNCIVVGTPENTGKSSSEWIVTLLHEHFHQYTYGAQNYQAEVKALDLANGDETGMWMLNYKFPYDNHQVIETYKSYITALKNVLQVSDNEEAYKNALTKYKAQRRQFKSQLNPSDYRYFSFQLWQEGIARYTEYKFLELLENYTPSNALKNMEDFIDFSTLKQQHKTKAIEELSSMDLSQSQRVCFYAVGMAEGLLLDRQNPEWRKHYLAQKFYLETYR
jgi:hypothetical protein